MITQRAFMALLLAMVLLAVAVKSDDSCCKQS